MNGDRLVATGRSDQRAASRFSVIALALFLAGCGSAPSASPARALPASPAVSATPSVMVGATVPPPTHLATPAPSTEVASTPIATAIPVADSSPTPTAGPTPSSCVALGTYTVAVGDTLWDIAQNYGVTVESLLAANPQITDRRLIRPGDEITISPLYLGALGGSWSAAYDINERGEIVGWATTADGFLHAFLWQGGTMTDLGTLDGGNMSVALAINNRGQVVGYGTITSDDPGPGGPYRAFIWQDGVMTDLGTLGGADSRARNINDRGQVVGSSETVSGVGHAFLWENGTMTDLGTLGGTGSSAVAINERGQVLGTSSSLRDFLWQDGVMTDLGNHGWVRGPGSSNDLNDHGEVVGWLEELSGAHHAFIAHDGTNTELGTVAGTRVEPSAINNHDQIVGWTRAGPNSRESRAFLWQAGTAVDLGAFAQPWSLAQSINDCGQVVGTSGPATQYNHAILWVTPVPRD